MIVLVGFMAAGKSTVGRLLAERLGWEFVDLDDHILARTGRTPARIIRDDGEAAFRAVEAEATRELAGRERLVLAPGGGWGVDPRTMVDLGAGSIRIWLRIPAAEAVRRAEADSADRPLLGDPGTRLERAEALLRERETSYETADHVVDAAGRAPDEVVDAILAWLRGGSGGP